MFVRGGISPERVPARLLFLTVSVFFRPRGSLLFLGGVLLCTSVENLSFFVVAGLVGSFDLVRPRTFGRIDLDLVSCFGESVLVFGMKLKEGLGIANGNCLGFFFFGGAAGELILGFKYEGPSPEVESPGSSRTPTPSCQLECNIEWVGTFGASWYVSAGIVPSSGSQCGSIACWCDVVVAGSRGAALAINSPSSGMSNPETLASPIPVIVFSLARILRLYFVQVAQ